MKTSIPNITNVRLKDGGAQLYLLPKVERSNGCELKGHIAGLRYVLADLPSDNAIVCSVTIMMDNYGTPMFLTNGDITHSMVGVLRLYEKLAMDGSWQHV